MPDLNIVKSFFFVSQDLSISKKFWENTFRRLSDNPSKKQEKIMSCKQVNTKLIEKQ